MTMNPLTREFLTELADDNLAQPRLSLYLPTHRRHPENQQDPIRYRSLVKQLELLVGETLPAEQMSELMQPFHALAEDEDFWKQTLDGLAAFAAPGWFRVVGLPRSVQELTVVAPSFHTKPLRRLLQSSDRYQVLGLNQHGITLYEGDRNGITPIQPVSIPTPGEGEPADEDLAEAIQTVASLSGSGNALHHGQGGKRDEVNADADRFFRAVDRSVLEAYSRPSGLPLILAALPEHHHRFHELSHNPFLVAEGIKTHPDSLSSEDLCVHAWQIFEPLYHARLASQAEDYGIAKSQNLGLEDLAQIGEAAVAGRIATLLIEADRQITGQVHPGSGNIHLDEAEAPQSDDLLDDLGEWVLKMGGHVFVIPAAQMPTTTGAAAICRY